MFYNLYLSERVSSGMGDRGCSPGQAGRAAARRNI